MCYDISYEIEMKELADYFPELNFDSQYEIDFPPFDHVQGPGLYLPHPIIFQNKSDGELHCKLMEWGIIRDADSAVPNKKDPEYIRNRNLYLNIKSERVLADPKSYWYKIKSNRCLVPVTGIYEHREVVGWKTKVPYWIRPKNQHVFFIPGLYSVVTYIDKQTGEMYPPLWTFAFMTRTPTEGMKNIHNSSSQGYRMVSFIPLGMAKEYVSNDLSLERYAEILDYKMPFEDLIYHPVLPLRSSMSRPDNKSKAAFFDWKGLPALGRKNPREKGIDQLDLFKEAGFE